jgi:hypothetical protein
VFGKIFNKIFSLGDNIKDNTGTTKPMPMTSSIDWIIINKIIRYNLDFCDEFKNVLKILYFSENFTIATMFYFYLKL